MKTIIAIKTNQDGQTAIILAILVLAVLLTIGLGLSALALNQIKTMRAVGFSVEAFYAADAGAEKCLYQVRQSIASECGAAGGGTASMTLSNGSSFIATKAATPLINSLGQYQTASRKIELSWTE
jgi:Na+/H+ antiporter NhaC